ncbi:membrane alanyl aminopeptidase-like isoform X2 [Trichoplusia ni]|uniref:Membrane alanyl aminopeptidase-like isoform X2 n=1 Tax=Trichoplusia ni TaxID=7111 RepID=A0A7E5W8T7_TRINI|nr:membrane alanyl aminopeptidase-like isoform X2 [Trichoplusia ni]
MGAYNVLECLFIITIVTVSAKPIDVNEILRIEDVVLPEIVSQETFEVVNATRNSTNSFMRNTIGDGMAYTDFRVELTPNVADGTFTGRLEVDVLALTTAARDSDVLFYVGDLDIKEVLFTFGQGTHQMAVASFGVNDDDILEIEPGVNSNQFRFFIEYSGDLQPAGTGLYAGRYGTETYVGMNLHPIYARRVFPCMDEPTLTAKFKFTFKNLNYQHIVSNSALEDNSDDTFRTLESPPHLWGMVAHNLAIINTPIQNAPLFARPGLTGQMSQPSVAINSYYNFLNAWTNRSFVDIIADQNGNMNILALPDVSKDWNSLSTVGIWEPYIMMTEDCSIRQRSLAFPKIAEAMARQWFGGVIYPRNWAHEWVLSGLATYAGWEAYKEFQSDGTSTVVSVLDAHTLFVTEIIQESLLLDAYSSARILEPANIFNEDVIRDHIHGLLKYKAPAILRMFRLLLGDADNDFVHLGARARLNTGAFQPIDSDDFIDSMNSYWLAAGGNDHEYIKDTLTPWIKNNGYPVLNVLLRRGGVFVSQERFGFASQTPVSYDIPITFTTSVNPNFVDTMYPSGTLGGTDTIDMDLDEEDWVLFNIQGQGYYRVNYDPELWETLTEVLDDPDQREDIHPLNRGTLVDDALNLARGRRLTYEIAFNLVLTMQHETNYPAWKAFVRNMEFLRKRLVAMVTEDEI